MVDLLKGIGMSGCKLIETPMKTSAKFGAQPYGSSVDKREIPNVSWESCLFIPSSTSYKICSIIVSPFINNPAEEHLQVMYRILRYLILAPRQGLFARNLVK